jgi:hypothetical protein
VFSIVHIPLLSLHQSVHCPDCTGSLKLYFPLSPERSAHNPLYAVSGLAICHAILRLMRVNVCGTGSRPHLSENVSYYSASLIHLFVICAPLSSLPQGGAHVITYSPCKTALLSYVKVRAVRDACMLGGYHRVTRNKISVL